MARLKTLRSSLPILPTGRTQVLSAYPDATPCLRGSRWMKVKDAWLEAHPMCAHCKEQDGIVTPAQQVDHIVPLGKGGADDASNYQSLCIPHHLAKTKREAAERARGEWSGEVIRPVIAGPVLV